MRQAPWERRFVGRMAWGAKPLSKGGRRTVSVLPDATAAARRGRALASGLGGRGDPACVNHGRARMCHVKIRPCCLPFVALERSCHDRSGFEIIEAMLRLAMPCLAVLGCLCGFVAVAQSTSLLVANGSFESPVVPGTLPMDVRLAGWTKLPAPSAFVPQGALQSWEQTSGVVPIPPVGQAGRIPNADGNQTARLLTIFEAGFYQELPAKVEAGSAYDLTVAVRGGGNIASGALLLLALYYVDDALQQVNLAHTFVNYRGPFVAAWPALTDVSVRTPVVSPGDGAVGRNLRIGIMALSGYAEGYWELDNVRVTATAAPKPPGPVQSIPVPNSSFEEPVTASIDQRIAPWQRTEKPSWFDEGGGVLWGQLVCTFANPASGKPDHIANLDGNQAARVFVVSGAGIWQELAPEGSAKPVRYEPGKEYQLSVDVLGSGVGMVPGTPLEVGFCHVLPDGTRAVVATQTVRNEPGLFPVRTQMTTFRVTTPVVKPSDPWAGRPVAIMAVSKESRDAEGGYWDIDNFRVTAAVAPEVSIEAGPGGLSLAWTTSRGWRYQALRSVDLKAWSPWSGLVEGSGEVVRIPVMKEGDAHGFFRVAVAPGE